MKMMVTAYYRTEIGLLEIVGCNDGIAGIRFLDEEPVEIAAEIPEPLRECVRQLEEYFDGRRKEFTVPLIHEGTAFQRRVWDELLTVPYGVTTSYADIAERIDNPKGVRAVGHANGQNPVWIIIPCHRIIGKNGQLRGYGGGLWRKEWLLQHESNFNFGA